jgi:hypothetical protein
MRRVNFLKRKTRKTFVQKAKMKMEVAGKSPRKRKKGRAK